MNQNLFQQHDTRRRTIREQARKARELGWIDEAQECEIAGKIDNDTLTIGVIGQMKCGKSTFLNAFVFEKEVLPAATTPMTAALTVITYNPGKYGTDEKLIAEFYTKDEWEELVLAANRSLEDVSDAEKMKINAARDLVDKSAVLGADRDALLGTTGEDEFKNLKEYVGAEGRYVSITKAVTINYPRDYLKGVEIVDTPGFNDPIVSREERTRQFLRHADVVLLLLYAGRPFDDTDSFILFKQVRACGVGKVVVGVNKYDMPYADGETPEKIAQYVTDEITKKCEEVHDDSLAELVREAKPILFSAHMALLSQLPMGEIKASKDKSFHWERYCRTFEVTSQSQIGEKSNIDTLIASVRDIIEREKGAILFKKPVNALLAAGNNVVGDLGNQKREQEALLINLAKPDDELEDTIETIGIVKRRLGRKLEDLNSDLNLSVRKREKECHTRMEDELDGLLKKMTYAIRNWGTFSSKDAIAGQLTDLASNADSLVLRRPLRDVGEDLVLDTKKAVRDFMDNIDFIEDKLPEYRDLIDGFVKKVEAQVDYKIEADYSCLDDMETSLDEFGNSFIEELADGIVTRFLFHDSRERELLGMVAKIRRGFDPEGITSGFAQKVGEVAELIKNLFDKEFFGPVEQQLNDCLRQKGDKEASRKAAEIKLVGLKAECEQAERNLNDMKTALVAIE